MQRGMQTHTWERLDVDFVCIYVCIRRHAATVKICIMLSMSVRCYIYVEAISVVLKSGATSTAELRGLFLSNAVERPMAA